MRRYVEKGGVILDHLMVSVRCDTGSPECLNMSARCDTGSPRLQECVEKLGVTTGSPNGLCKV